MCNIYITNHFKKFDLYLVKHDSKLAFDTEFYPKITSEFQYNTKIFHLNCFFYIGLNNFVK